MNELQQAAQRYVELMKARDRAWDTAPTREVYRNASDAAYEAGVEFLRLAMPDSLDRAFLVHRLRLSVVTQRRVLKAAYEVLPS